ncbi:MAG: alcohol dehydrogenase catalytic domain-containing protein [Verrucomicrobia bacterium]|nr:alcohol dehydrogenase catalytic domain-containing protein [Verrucomicrobiota bacterium]
MTTIKAVVYHGPLDVRCESVPMPVCGADEIRVQVDACAVCGSDWKAYKTGNPRMRPPITMGHEFSGLIESIGAGVHGHALGERVVMATSVSCGECLYCRRGWRNLCTDLRPMGFYYNGGMAELVTIPARALEQGHVVKVPATVKAIHAALSEPVSCCVNAAENCGIVQGDVVAVLGAGPMGILNACVAREFGASKIILSEVNPARLKQAGTFGFDRLVNPATDDLTKIIMDETGGYGADVVIVSAPAAQPQEQAMTMVRKRGTVCLFASLPAGNSMLNVDSRPMHYGELRVVGTSDSTASHVQRAVELIAGGSLPVEKIASHVLRLDDIQQAFALMESGEALRVVLTP